MILKYLYKGMAYLVFPLIAIVTYGAFMRYLFHAMPVWSFEMTIFLFGIMIMIGGPYIHSEKKHIRVDILEKYLPTRLNILIQGVSEIIIIFSCLVFLYISLPWVWDSFLLKERSVHATSFNPAIWWFKAVIPISLILLIQQSIRNLYRQIIKYQEILSSSRKRRGQ